MPLSVTLELNVCEGAACAVDTARVGAKVSVFVNPMVRQLVVLWGGQIANAHARVGITTSGDRGGVGTP
jgi:hypothetical protein